jgi:hypothetical protein
MRKNARIALLIGACALLLTATITPGIVGARREFLTYGSTPGIQFGEQVADEGQTSCIWINYVAPPAHHDYFGRVWQDEHLLWDEVEIRERWNGTWDHGMTGPMRVGDEICQVPKYHEWIYKPEDRVFLTMG